MFLLVMFSFVLNLKILMGATDPAMISLLTRLLP